LAHSLNRRRLRIEGASWDELVSMEVEMGLFDMFRKKPKTMWDALQGSPAFQQQRELFEAMSLVCEAGIDADEMPNGRGEFGMVPSKPYSLQNCVW
jgi:hypothetical protein